MSKPGHEADKFVYIFYSVKLVDREPVITIGCTAMQEFVAHQEGCKRLLQDLRERFGDPKPLSSDDDLARPEVFNNQQMLAAFDCYKNADKFTTGENAGKVKLSWMDKYRRIDAIYEKLRSDDPKIPQTYYYIVKQKLTIVR